MRDEQKTKLYENIKQEIRSLLISSPKTKYGGLSGSLLYHDYKELNCGKEIPCKHKLFLFLFFFKLLIKPIKYRLILGQLQSNQSVNLKILASVMLYLGRRTAGPKSHILVCQN